MYQVPLPLSRIPATVQQLLFYWQRVEHLVFTPVFSVWRSLAPRGRKPLLSSPPRGVSGVVSPCVVCPWAGGSRDFCSRTPARAHNPASSPRCRFAGEIMNRKVRGRCLLERRRDEHVAHEGTQLRCFSPCSPKAASLQATRFDVQ